MTKKERAKYLNDLIIPDMRDNTLEESELRMNRETALRDTIKELEQELPVTPIRGKWVKGRDKIMDVVEDIKAEIEHIDRHKDKFTMMYTRPDLIDMVLDEVLTIIDKHISKKENEDADGNV